MKKHYNPDLYPGVCPDTEVTRPMPHMAAEFIKFMLPASPWTQFKVTDTPVLDIGDGGYKVEQMRRYWKMVDTWMPDDLNWPVYGDYPKPAQTIRGKYKIITCFETIEHLQNPLSLISCIYDPDTQEVSILDDNGTLYLSCPGRPKWLWGRYHFREYTPAELQRWLLNPCGLEIVRSKRVWIDAHWTKYLRGIRPFLRLFFDYTRIYEIRRKQ